MRSDHQLFLRRNIWEACDLTAVRRKTWRCDRALCVCTCVCFRRTGMNVRVVFWARLRCVVWTSQLQQVWAATNIPKALPKPGECYTYYIPANRRTGQKRTMSLWSCSSLTGGPALGRLSGFLQFEASCQVLNCHSAVRGRQIHWFTPD